MIPGIMIAIAIVFLVVVFIVLYSKKNTTSTPNNYTAPIVTQSVDTKSVDNPTLAPAPAKTPTPIVTQSVDTKPVDNPTLAPAPAVTKTELETKTIISAPVKPPVVTPPPLAPVCNLDCNNVVMTQAKNFYNTKGEWKGVFTMDPTDTNKVNEKTCAVAYTYNPVPGGGRRDSGYDKRLFVLHHDGSCNWSVVSMGDYMSGSTV